MRLAVEAFFATLLLSFIGMLIDSNVGLDGNFSVVLAVATMGAFVIYAIDRNKK